MTDTVPGMANHWWWRPGWGPGSRFYTWHLTFQDQPGLHQHAEAYRRALSPLPVLDLVPDRWLHLTTQGVGFVDQVDEADVDAIVAAARTRLAKLQRFTLRFAAPAVDTEGVAWRLGTSAVTPVRDAIRAAIGEVWTQVPERADGFGAHVSLAYANADSPGQPVAAALEAVHRDPVAVSIDAAELIVLNRDNRMYEWETFATVPLGEH